MQLMKDYSVVRIYMHIRLVTLFLLVNCITFFPFLRTELDHLDTDEKYPELFSVSLEYKVSATDKKRAGDSCPWEGFSSKGLSPRILFGDKEEQQMAMKEFRE